MVGSRLKVSAYIFEGKHFVIYDFTRGKKRFLGNMKRKRKVYYLIIMEAKYEFISDIYSQSILHLRNLYQR